MRFAEAGKLTYINSSLKISTRQLTYIKFGYYNVDERQHQATVSDKSRKELRLAPLTDSTRLAAYEDALANWNFDGYIRFELTESSYQWIKRELNNISLKEIGRLMYKYVESGGEIDEVPETRSEWSDYEFHYDLRFTIQDKPVYIESRLNYKLPFVPDDSTILVVNIHAP